MQSLHLPQGRLPRGASKRASEIRRGRSIFHAFPHCGQNLREATGKIAIAVLIAATAVPSAVAEPINHPNGPTHCAADGKRIWWTWQRDGTVKVIRDGVASLGAADMSANQRATVFMSIVQDDGEKVELSWGNHAVEIFDSAANQRFSLCYCSGKPCTTLSGN